jgi:amino acid transporter
MRRSLGPFDVLCVGLNAIVGSGIFLLPDDLYRELGWLSPLAFVLCCTGLWPVALCYSEAASSVTTTGGPYVYARRAFGPQFGFLVGWMCFTNSMFSFAAVAAAAAAATGQLIPFASDPLVSKLVALAIIGTFAGLNYFGAKPGALAINAFTLAKFAVLFVLVGALLPTLDGQALQTEAASGGGGWGPAVFMALFAAQGFEVVPVPAGETRAPTRTVPFAVMGSLLACSIVYSIVQGVLVLAFADLGRVSDTPLTDAALAIAPQLGFLVAIGGLISALGFVSGSALGTPRYLYAAASDGELPRPLASLHPRFESPHLAILLTAGLAAACVIPFDYRSLIGMSNVAVAVQYLATCLAVLKFRYERANGAWTFRFAAVPLLGAAVSLWIFTEASRVELIWAGCALALGVAIRALSRRIGVPAPHQPK